MQKRCSPTISVETVSDTLAELLDEPRATDPFATGSPLVGFVVDDRHPTLLGRVAVELAVRGCNQRCWLPTLQHLAIRTGDRVLIVKPDGCHEPVVIGVIDGYTNRPAPRCEPAAALELKHDESIRVTDSRGQPLLEVSTSEQGPTVRLCQPGVNVELEGAFSLTADAIALHARKGPVQVEASEDVVVQGETIHLN